ncbi:MAG: DUF3800 domain-containing protein [Chloroflexota bacterium]
MNRPKPYKYWIFCDESGNLSNPSNRYLIGVAVGTKNPEALKKVTNRIYEQNRRTLQRGKPLHAAELNTKIVMRFLKQIAKMEANLDLFIMLLDKQWIWHYKKRTTIYNELFAHLIRQTIAAQEPAAISPLIVLEKRDNVNQYRNDLLSKLEESAALKEEQIQICGKDDKQWGRQLQVADVVAWSIYQKYENQHEQFFELLKHQIRLETVWGIDGTGIMRPISEMNN